MSALLDPESTGAIAILAFAIADDDAASESHVWVCRHDTEEDIVEDHVGPVEPGKAIIWPPAQLSLPSEPASRTSCALDTSEIPPAWLAKFPTGLQLVQKSIELRPDMAMNPDQRLMRRRACEYEVFLSVERAAEMPHILSGFTAIDDFVARAQSILQRRKARAGRSLELHTRQIFVEERLREGEQFSWQPKSDANKRPDFLFRRWPLIRTAVFRRTSCACSQSRRPARTDGAKSLPRPTGSVRSTC